MLALLSLACLTCGVLAAANATRFPALTARLETVGGLALVAGLAMIGAGIRTLG